MPPLTKIFFFFQMALGESNELVTCEIEKKGGGGGGEGTELRKMGRGGI